jgi:TRAP-type C4-dicarboxylate transport system substrate-binding protein
MAAALPVSADAQTRWDMPTPYADSVFHTANIIQFADDVRAATDGAMDITVHSAGSLFGHADIKDAVRRGLVPIGEILMSRLSNEDPIFEVDSIPFLAASYEEADALWQATRARIEEKMAAQGLTVLFAVPWPGQSLFMPSEFKDPEEMRGLRFRAYNAATERLAQLMGAIPTQVEAPDVPTAFSTGRIEVFIASSSSGVNYAAWDFVTHFIDTQAWLPKNIIFVNTSALEALPDDQRKAVLEAASAAEARGLEMSRAENDTQIALLQEKGMTVVQPSDAVRTRMQEIGQTMLEEWLAVAGDEGAAVVESYRALID